MRNNFKVYDIEHHFNTKLISDEYKKTPQGKVMTSTLDSFGTTKESSEQIDVEFDFGEIRLATMDKAGVDYAHLSLTTPGSEFFPAEISKKVATDANNKLGEAIKAHPDRIGGWMALAPEDPEWSIKEIDRCLKMGLWGWSCLSNFNGKYLDDPKYWPILEKVEAIGMPIYLHPNFTNVKECTEFGYCLSGPALGFTFDTLICVMRLIHRGVFDRFPKLKVILGHDGEGLPFLMNRIDTAYRQGAGKPTPNINGHNEHEPSYYIKNNFYCSTSGNFLLEAFHLALREFTPDKVMLATDFPYEDFEGGIDLVEKDSMLLTNIKKAVLADNAASLGLCPKHK